jgi:tetratricopeptide (TPR) repeat protein
VGGILIWACATGFFVGPILLAEQSAADANEQIRTAPIARSAESAAHFQRAADDLAIAARLVPFNADYVFRQAQACIGTGDLTQAAALLNRVKQMDPMQLDGYLLDANLQLSQPHPNAKTVCDDFSAVTKLNPNDVPLHMQFGDALQRFGMTADAREQYKLALNANAALPEGEPKRLSPEETEILRKKAGIDVP